MAVKRSQAEKDLDARRNEAARREIVARDRRRSPTENLEEAMTVQAQAAVFARAFRLAREPQDE